MANKTYQGNATRKAGERAGHAQDRDTKSSIESSYLAPSQDFDEDDELDHFPGWNPTRW